MQYSLPERIALRTISRFARYAGGTAEDIVRRTRFARAALRVGSLLVASTAVVAALQGASSFWLLALLAFSAFFLWILPASVTAWVPWDVDRRRPVLVSHSFTDVRLRHGPEQPPPDGVLISLGPLNLIDQISMQLRDQARIVAFSGAAFENDFQHFCVVVDGGTGWKEPFAKIARSSWFTLVIPARTQSCIDEMKMLRDERLLDRTLVLMPPRTRLLDGAGHGLEERNWIDIAEELSKHSFTLPVYDRAGLLYRPNERYAIEQSTTLDGWGRYERAANLIAPSKLDGCLGDLLHGLLAWEAGEIERWARERALF